MANIAFASIPESGHFNATRHLAKALSARGHNVRYMGPAPDKDFYSADGLPYYPVIVDDTLKFVPPASSRNGVPEAFRPDLVLADAANPQAGLMAYRNGIPFARLSTTLPLGRDHVVPPLTSSLAPGPWVQAAWWARAASLRLERFKVVLLRRNDWLKGFRQLVRASGYPEADVDYHSVSTPLLKCPELVLMSGAFDFPRPHPSCRHYLGLSIDTTRDEADLPTLDENRPLVYCAFGSQLHVYPDLKDRLTVVLEVAAERRHLEFVIAAGSLARELPRIPANVHVLDVAPQLKLLRRATVMLSHGGLNSVKEALYFGVPLVVSPMVSDQPGNAARVAYHGLGLVVNQPSPQRLGTALDRIFLEPHFAARSNEAGTHFRAEQEGGLDVSVTETLLDPNIRACFFGREKAKESAQRD